MEIYECKHQVKCEFSGCPNIAKYSFSTKGKIKKDLCFCENCLKQMYEILLKMHTPKAVKSPFKLNKKLRRDYE